MATNPPVDDDDVDDDTLEAFNKVMRKFHGKNPKWLTELYPNFSPEASSPKGAGDLTTFLQGLLSKEETKAATLADRLEAALSLMTPEQLTQFRSVSKNGASGKGSGEDGPKPGEPPSPPDDPPMPTKPKRKWL